MWFVIFYSKIPKYNITDSMNIEMMLQHFVGDMCFHIGAASKTNPA